MAYNENKKELIKHFEEMFYDQILKHRRNLVVNVKIVKEFKTWLNNRLRKLGQDADNENIHTNKDGKITRRIKKPKL